MITDPAKVMDVQYYFQRRLKDCGITIYFYGATDIPGRWEQIRSAIVGSHLSNAEIGKVLGAKETFWQSYCRATGEPLESAA